MTAADMSAAIGAWTSRTRSKIATIRAEHARVFPGARYESPSGSVAISIGPNLELLSFDIHPAGQDIRDVLERELVQAYNTAFANARTERDEAMSGLAASRRNGA